MRISDVGKGMIEGMLQAQRQLDQALNRTNLQGKTPDPVIYRFGTEVRVVFASFPLPLIRKPLAHAIRHINDQVVA